LHLQPFTGGREDFRVPAKKPRKKLPDTCKRTDGLKQALKVQIDFSKTFIDQLVARRIKMGYSQSWVNEIIGVGDGLVAKWETGQRRPSGFLLFCWVEALQCQLQLVPNPHDQ
jgi:hypothetical protein